MFSFWKHSKMTIKQFFKRPILLSPFTTSPLKRDKWLLLDQYFFRNCTYKICNPNMYLCIYFYKRPHVTNFVHDETQFHLLYSFHCCYTLFFSLFFFVHPKSQAHRKYRTQCENRRKIKIQTKIKINSKPYAHYILHSFVVALVGCFGCLLLCIV